MLENTENYKNAVNIYTDASKPLDDKTSAAFCVPKLNIERSVISVFAAELTAIKLALLTTMMMMTQTVHVVTRFLKAILTLIMIHINNWTWFC